MPVRCYAECACTACSNDARAAQAQQLVEPAAGCLCVCARHALAEDAGVRRDAGTLFERAAERCITSVAVVLRLLGSAAKSGDAVTPLGSAAKGKCTRWFSDVLLQAQKSPVERLQRALDVERSMGFTNSLGPCSRQQFDAFLVTALPNACE